MDSNVGPRHESEAVSESDSTYGVQGATNQFINISTSASAEDRPGSARVPRAEPCEWPQNARETRALPGAADDQADVYLPVN